MTQKYYRLLVSIFLFANSILLLSQETNELEDPNEGLTWSKIKTEIISNYSKIIQIDTVYHCQNDSVNVKAKLFCNYDSLIALPKEMIWGDDSNFVTHSFSIELHINSKRLNIDTILTHRSNKEIFAGKKGYENLERFGVFNSIYIKQITCSKVLIPVVISIPMTDLGAEIMLEYSDNRMKFYN